MKYSPKNPPPEIFETWLKLADENPDWTPTYRDFRDPEKPAVFQSLLAEQGYVCCYCGRRIENGDGHIDHFWPQKHFNGEARPDLRLNYDNFFGSCGPPGKVGVPKARPSTCGDAKGKWYDEAHHVIPSDPNCEARFAFGQSGKISAMNSHDQGALNMIKHLALDDASLDGERAVIIAEVEDALTNGSSAQLELQRLRTPVNGELPNFGHVVARYLELEFGLANQD